MKDNHKKLLTYFGISAVALGVCGVLPWVAGYKMSPVQARKAGDLTPEVFARVTAPGVLLTGADADIQILKGRNRAQGRSPAFEVDSSRDTELAALTKDFLNRDSMSTTNERLKEFFPDGKGVNQSIRLILLLATRGTEGAHAFSELTLMGKVQSEVITHGESAVVSLTTGLSALPREMVRERQTVIRLLSNIGSERAELRTEVKTALLAEAARAGSSPDGALALTALLRVNPTKEWFAEVNASYERLHPGSELSDVVALNVVAL